MKVKPESKSSDPAPEGARKGHGDGPVRELLCSGEPDRPAMCKARASVSDHGDGWQRATTVRR
jgi:hypothetical protein